MCGIFGYLGTGSQTPSMRRLQDIDSSWYGMQLGSYRSSEQTVHEVFFQDHATVTGEVTFRQCPNLYMIATARK